MQALQFEMPTRGMVGVKSRLLTLTRGEAVMTTTFAGYLPHVGNFMSRDRGKLLAHEGGVATSYGLERAQERASDLFTRPGESVFEDMIVGINSKAGAGY